MSGSDSGEKSEEPTEKKLDDARKEGNVAKSRDLGGVVAFGTAMAIVKAIWDDFETRTKHLFFYAIDQMSHPVDLSHATQEAMNMALVTLAIVSIPVALGAGIVAGLVDFIQVGGLFTMQVLVPKLEKLNFIEGMKKLVGKKQIVEALKSLFKLFVTGYVVYGVVYESMGMLVATIHGDANLTMKIMGELVYRVTQKVVLLLVVFAVFDVWWQRKTFMKEMMMSKEDVKKEYKQSEGDPHHKAKRKQLHMEILEGAQMEAVKSADVVVTNPEHVAVAIGYDRLKDQAPRVLAKGINAKAEQIREIARAADVSLMRNVPLAHALLRIELNDEIPEELYDAVAEVLNFVYQLKEGAEASASVS